MQRTRARSRGTSSRSSWASTRRSCPKPTAPAAPRCWWTQSSKWTTPQGSGPASRNTNPSPIPPETRRSLRNTHPKISYPLQKKKHVYTHTHTQVFAYTFGPNKALGGWEVVKERKVLPFPAPPKCRTLWRIFLYFLFGCFPDPFIVSVFKSLPIPEWCRVQEGWELYASLRRRIILTAGNFQHLYSEVQACHMSCHSKEKTSCLYFSVWMWPSQLITDLSELNMICERGKKKKRRKERTVMTVIIEVTKKWIVLNAVKFCLEPSGRCLIIFHPFSKEGKKIKWQQTPQRLFFPFLSHL